MKHRSRWRGLICLLVSLGAAVWFAWGCGATGSMAPTGGGGGAAPIPIELAGETVETQFSAVTFGDVEFQ